MANDYDALMPTKIGQWAPVFTALAQKLGLVTACVYGTVWRYCKMRDGVCYASQERMAQSIGITRQAFNQHLGRLVDLGLLEDLTPDAKNRPHVYRLTGKAYLAVEIKSVVADEIEAGTTVDDNEDNLADRAYAEDALEAKGHRLNFESADEPADNQVDIGASKDDTYVKQADAAAANQVDIGENADDTYVNQDDLPSVNQNAAPVNDVDAKRRIKREKRKRKINPPLSQSEVVKNEIELFLGIGAGPELVSRMQPGEAEAFRMWWMRYDWRGKRGELPTARQVIEKLPAFRGHAASKAAAEYAARMRYKAWETGGR